MGREGHRDDVAHQAPRRPRERDEPGLDPQQGQRRPPQGPQDHAKHRGRGQHLRRVRLLRAGLPEPPPDHHPAPAHRAAPRDGETGRGHAGPARPARGVRIRRDRDLRHRRLLPAGLPGRHRHRCLHQGLPRRTEHACRRKDGPACRAPLGPGREARPWRTRRRRGDLEGHLRRCDARPDPCRPQVRECRPGAGVGREDAALGRGEAAGDFDRRRRRGLHARLHQPHVRPLEGRRWRPLAARGPGRGLRPCR